MATGPVGGTYPAVVVVHDLQHPRKGGNTPFPSDTVPVTSTFLLGPAWVSSSAVIVTIPAWSRPPQS